MKTYINTINELLATEDILSESEIATMIMADNEIENNSFSDFDEEEEEVPSPVTSKEALNALKILIRYEEQLSDNNENSINNLRKKLLLYERMYEKTKKQVSLEHMWDN
ncbi:hypothetical protein Glove_51g17 [Diversispora epigaea]|uniref:Uncharacterized protein n=1 Tax=Diversispora epigaea TaxID=1348612 RepID=A0A397JDH3_9GLOM|nr:hypothetical protein Glove_51g17 [Diversispora epigaea]